MDSTHDHIDSCLLWMSLKERCETVRWLLNILHLNKQVIRKRTVEIGQKLTSGFPLNAHDRLMSARPISLPSSWTPGMALMSGSAELLAIGWHPWRIGSGTKDNAEYVKNGRNTSVQIGLGLGHCGLLKASVQDREANEEAAFKGNGLYRCSFGRPTRAYNSGGDRVFGVEYADENPDSIRGWNRWDSI